MTNFGRTFRTCRKTASLWRGNRISQPVRKSSACPATSPILLATDVVHGGLYISTTSTTDPASGLSSNASKTASSSTSGARSARIGVPPPTSPTSFWFHLLTQRRLVTLCSDVIEFGHGIHRPWIWNLFQICQRGWLLQFSSCMHRYGPSLL